MTDHDRALVERLRGWAASQVVEADDPAAVAGALVVAGARSVLPSDVAAWAAEAQELRSLAAAVLAAEEVVARARSAEAARRRALVGDALADRPPSAGPGPTADGDDHDDHDEHADRAAVRFALVVLALAQVGGVAVYLADGLVLAVAAPALAMVGVIAVAVAHRRPSSARRSPAPATAGRGNGPGSDPAPDPERGPEQALKPGPELGTQAPGVPDPPVVRAAQAHLRRHQAAWKVAWWERGLPPGDVSAWVGPAAGDGPPATLVVADPDGEVDDGLVATMTSAVPATVRVVVVRRRPA